MKKLVSLLVAGAIFITALFSAVSSSADEWGRPDVYKTPAYPQSYGGTGTNIERSTLSESLSLTLRADRNVYDGGAVKFTVSIANAGGAVEATALGVTPAYDVNVFDPDAEAQGDGWGNLNARILWEPSNGWYNVPFVNLSTAWDARNRTYFMVAAWEKTAVLNVPAMLEASDFFEFSLVPRDAGAEPSWVYVYVQIRNGNDEFARLLSVKVGEGDPAIKRAGVSIEDNLTVNVSANVPEAYGTPRMRFRREGQPATEVVGSRVDGLWRFEFPGIYAQCMCDAVSMELLAGNGAVLDSRTGFTIRNYALALAQSSDDSLLKEALYAMLHFGAEAQKYKAYKLETLANEGVPATQPVEKPSGYIVSRRVDPAYQIVSASLHIDNAFFIRIKVEASKDPQITFENGALLDFTEAREDAAVAFYTDKLTLSEIGKTLIVKNGGNTLKYSILAYLSRLWDNAEAGDIVKALYSYYLAAVSYEAGKTAQP